jgi:RNA polymerase sigma-70 factor (ECF subfamily)
VALKFVQRGNAARRGVGGTGMLDLLHSLPEPQQRTVADFDEEYRNELFRRAAERAQGEFRESTWLAFWRTCVFQEPIADVADELGMTTGNVYVARSRVIARLRQIVETYDAEANSKTEAS